jgi:hypothetical protein
MLRNLPTDLPEGKYHIDHIKLFVPQTRGSRRSRILEIFEHVAMRLRGVVELLINLQGNGKRKSRGVNRHNALCTLWNWNRSFRSDDTGMRPLSLTGILEALSWDMIHGSW